VVEEAAKNETWNNNKEQFAKPVEQTDKQVLKPKEEAKS